MGSGEEEMRKSLEEVLALYDVKLDLAPSDTDGGKEERRGDYAALISKTQQRLDDLTEKAEVIYKRLGMNREQLEAYASNPNNFTKEQWEALQHVKEACDKYKREAHAWIGEETTTAASKKGEKERGDKNRFAKKKNWIPL